MADNAKKGLLQSGLQYFCLMPNNLMVQDLKTNRKLQEKLLKYMFNVGARAAWIYGVRRVSDALDVSVMVDKLSILNPSPFDTIIDYIMKDEKDEEARKKLSQRRLNIIDGSINSYCVHLNSPALMDLVWKANG